ncbi:hypothetical protein BDR05DRAFT_961963 [Suillus weaverae]|nr:hypothetical protein BDR05DRAFT_961963 [Suillus weaverae]
MEGLAGVAKAEWCDHSRYNAASNVVGFLIQIHGRKLKVTDSGAQLMSSTNNTARSITLCMRIVLVENQR